VRVFVLRSQPLHGLSDRQNASHTKPLSINVNNEVPLPAEQEGARGTDNPCLGDP